MPKSVPPYRTREKALIWSRHDNPVGWKFYGTLKKTRLSQPEKYEISVVSSRRMNPKAMAFWVRQTVGRMIHARQMPPEIDYKTYPSFMELHGLQWQKVHKVLYYRVDHTRT